MTPSENLQRTLATSSIKKRRVALLICLAISAGTGLVRFLEQNGSQSFTGSLRAKTTVVSTNRSARIHQISVKTGQSVVAGEPLIQLIDPQLELRQSSKRREIAEFEAEVARAKATAEVELAWRRRDLQAEIFETQLKMATLSQDKLNKQVEEIAWKERLTSGDFGTTSNLPEMDLPFRPISMEIHLPDDRRMQAILREDAAAAAAETLAIQITLCEQRLKKLQALDQELEVKIRASSGIDVAETRLKTTMQELDAFENQAKELAVTSPTFGTVGEVKLQSGDLVTSGATLVEILDETQPHIIAQIPAGVASRLQPGSRMILVFPMNERRLGIVSTIPPQASVNPNLSESFVAVKIEPSGKLWPRLAFGSSVKVLTQ